MAPDDYSLDLDRCRRETLQEQARRSIITAIQANREGFRLGQRLSASRLSRHNTIHRNTLISVMDDLVRQGYLRRLPNRGFEIIDQEPDRPEQLTRQLLSITEVARRMGLETRSVLVDAACGRFQVGELKLDMERVMAGLRLDEEAEVAVLSRLRSMRNSPQGEWTAAAVEQSFIPLARIPNFLDTALRRIHQDGDFSVLEQLRRTFPDDEFFKAHYEISLLPLPESLAGVWPHQDPTLNILTTTYCSQGPIEVTYTWIDASRVTLLAGSLDVEIKND